MTENFERQRKFILEQHAKFVENLAKQQERFEAFAAQQAEAWAKRKEWDDAWVKQRAEALAEAREQNAQAVARSAELDRKIAELVGSTGILRDALISLTHHAERHDQQIAANERAIAELAERGKETDARLNALILIVERHISGHQ
jgi:hypothetical protein